MTPFRTQAGFNVLDSLQSGFSVLIDYIPRIIGALIVLLIGYIIAKLLKKGLTKLLQKARLDAKLTSGQGGHHVQRFSPEGSPSALLGTIVFWVIMVFVLSSAVATLGIPALTVFLNRVLSYIPNVIAALLILLIAVAIAGAVGGIVQRAMGETPMGRIVHTAAPALVMIIAVFMILTQLNIAPVIVSATFIALIGSLALGSALAFGLGGRDAAAEVINSGYRRAQLEQGQSGAQAESGAQQTQQFQRGNVARSDPYREG